LMSDSIVIAIEKASSDEDPLKPLATLLRIGQLLQVRLLKIGIWIRGAVSSGPIFIAPHRGIVVGEGLVNAWRLEKLAKFPRIIVDSRLAQEFSQTLGSMTQTLNERAETEFKLPLIFDIFDKLFIGDVPPMACDGMFIDWFAGLLTVSKQEFQRFAEFMERDSLTFQEHLDKYRWAIHYMRLSSYKFENFSNPSIKERATELGPWLASL
jgi:hypothetical protein